MGVCRVSHLVDCDLSIGETQERWDSSCYCDGWHVVGISLVVVGEVGYQLSIKKIKRRITDDILCANYWIRRDEML